MTGTGFVVLLLLVVVAGLPGAALAAAGPTGMMCELLAHPERTEITDPEPEFTWIVPLTERDDVQAAYQIRVAAEADEERFWDSGKVASDRNVAVCYAGKPLESRSSYGWQVRTWNRRGVPSAWSARQRFRTGVLGANKADDGGRVARYPIEQTEVAPARVINVGAGRYFLDFGRAAFGTLKLTLDCTPEKAGQAVVVHLGEMRDGPDRVHRKPGGSIRYHRAELTLKAGRHTYTVTLPDRDRRRMPPEIGAVMPFRYAEIEYCPSPITRDTARQIAAHYPFDDSAARFSSSDPVLNDVWELCRYSIKATTFCGLYVDGDRERLPYEADAYINQLGHYAVDREFTLARHTHEHLMRHPTWPTEWILHSVLMAWDDYLYTGDADSLAAFYGDLKAKALRALARPDGLISTVQPPVPREVLISVHSGRMQDIVDWPAGERDGYDMRPVNTVVNAFHFRALALMARIADALGKAEDAAAFRRDAARMAQSFNARLFDPLAGLYVDGEGSTHSSLHANLFALAFSLVPFERAAKVAAFVRGKGMACSVYGAQYLLEALYQTGHADHALHLMTDRDTDRGWAHMIYDVGTTITLEAWDNKYKPNQDWNHAWGAAPANIIPRLLMGVEPVEPGFRTLRIRPQPGGLARAALDLPTVRGPVHVDFDAAPAKFTLNVRLPANTSAEVYLPRLGSDDGTVLVDGVRRAGRISGDFIVIGPVGGGVHTLVREAAGKK